MYEVFMKTLIEKLDWENQYHKILLDSMKHEAEKLPKGYLVPKTINGKKYTYIRELQNEPSEKIVGTDKIVTRHNKLKAEAILRRRFLEKSIRQLENSIPRVEKFLKNHVPYDPQTVYDSICQGSVFIDIEAYFPNKSGNVRDEIINDTLDYEFLKELKKHVTPKGTMVRSKSEALIAGILELYGLEYQYEKRLTLGEKSFYPDFTLANHLSEEIIYWEHFGLTHDAEYRRAMAEKLAVYEEHGILPWKNLIITFDSEEGYIDMQRIHRILCNMAGLEPIL